MIQHAIAIEKNSEQGLYFSPNFLGKKLTPKHQYVSWCVIVVQKPWLVFPQIYALLTNCFAQSAHNFKSVFLINRTTLWQAFMMQHAIAIQENSEQNIQISQNLMCFFFLVLALLYTSIAVIGLWFQFFSITHILKLWTFWAKLDRHWISSTSQDRCSCDVVFA